MQRAAPYFRALSELHGLPPAQAQPRKLVERVLEAWRRGDGDEAAALFSENGSYAESGKEAIVGRAAMADHFARFFAVVLPWGIDIDDVIVEGERAAVAYRFWMIGPGGKRREHAGCALVRFDGGAIASWREYEG